MTRALLASTLTDFDLTKYVDSDRDSESEHESEVGGKLKTIQEE